MSIYQTPPAGFIVQVHGQVALEDLMFADDLNGGQPDRLLSLPGQYRPDITKFYPRKYAVLLEATLA